MERNKIEWSGINVTFHHFGFFRTDQYKFVIPLKLEGKKYNMKWINEIHIISFCPSTSNFNCSKQKNYWDTTVSWKSHIVWKSEGWTLYKRDDLYTHRFEVLDEYVTSLSLVWASLLLNVDASHHDEPLVVSKSMVRVRKPFF